MQFIKKLFTTLFLLILGFGAGFLANTFSKFEIVEKGSKTVSTSSTSTSTTSSAQSSVASASSITAQSSPIYSTPPTNTPGIDTTIKDGYYSTFKALNIPALKQSQQPGTKVRIIDGFFKVVGRINNGTQVNSGIENLNIIIDESMLKSINQSYNPKVGDLIKLTADFNPLISNPPAGYPLIDYYMQSVTKVEVISPQ